jgi:hypothetical protein
VYDCSYMCLRWNEINKKKKKRNQKKNNKRKAHMSNHMCVLGPVAEESCGGSTGMVGVETHGWGLKHVVGSKRVVGVKMCCWGQKYVGEGGDTWMRVEICG